MFCAPDSQRAGVNRFTALDDVTLSIWPNEFLTLLGPSGCGKTTLLRIIEGFEYLSEGQVLSAPTDLRTGSA
ncbi:ATP-binding cassette domain-containing protein [Sinorhizobium meliloti]